jgi:hypothetical protein
VGDNDASTETCLSEMVIDGEMSVPSPCPLAIITEEIITINSKISETEYRFRVMYIVDAYTN